MDLFSRVKKTENKKIISLFVILAIALGNAGSTLYLPAMAIIGSDLHAASSLMKLSLSFYLITFGLSQLLYGPLSDAFGRRINLIVGLIIFFIGSSMATFAERIDLFLISRLIQGLGMGTSSAVGFALIRDIYSGKELTKQLSYLSVFVGMTPIIAPLFGGYLTEYIGWRSCFITLAFLGLLLAFAKILYLPETNIHLDKKAWHPRTVTKNYLFLLKSPLFLCYVFTTSLAFSSLMVINTLLPFIITKSLAISPAIYGWLTLCTGGGYFTGAFVSGKLSAKYEKIKILTFGSLIQFVSLLIALLISFFFFNVWVVIAPLACILFGVGFLVPIGSSGAIEPFPQMAGSESAILGSAMFSVSSLFTAFASKIPEASQTYMLLYVLSIATITFIPLILLKRKYS